MARRIRTAGFAVAFVAAAGAVWALAVDTGPDLAWRTARVDRGTITSAISATGILQPVVQVDVGSQVSGLIAALPADFNDTVRQGEVLARLDTAEFENRVRMATAEVAMAHASVEMGRATLRRSEAEIADSRAAVEAAAARVTDAEVALREADRAFARSQDLGSRGVVSAAVVDEAEATRDRAAASLAAARADRSQLESRVLTRTADRAVVAADLTAAEARVDQAQAELAQAELDLRRATIVSPVDGVVMNRAVDVGQTVAASLEAPTLYTIARDLQDMEVTVSVDEADVGWIRAGLQVRFTVDAFPNRLFTGVVNEIRLNPTRENDVVTYEVIVDAPNPERLLLPGMTASVRVILHEVEDVLRVPAAALRFRPPVAGGGTDGPTAQARNDGVGPDEQHDDGGTVWLADSPSDTPRPLDVQTGSTDGVLTEITGGTLAEGDQVVVGILPAGDGSGPGSQPFRGGR